MRHLVRCAENAAWQLTLLVLVASLCEASSKLAISPSNPQRLKNSSLQFTASINGETLDGPVKWSSSNPAVATINGSSSEAMLIEPVKPCDHFTIGFPYSCSSPK